MEMQMVLQRVIMYDVYDGRRKALGTRAEAGVHREQAKETKPRNEMFERRKEVRDGDDDDDAAEGRRQSCEQARECRNGDGGMGRGRNGSAVSIIS